MKKINIVKRNEEFNNVLKSGKCVKNKYFILYYKKNDLGLYRFGISVPKKICNAVNRNKLKRKVRNIIDNSKNLYPKQEDYIIIVRKSCLDEDYKILEDNLRNLFKIIINSKYNKNNF